MSTGDPVKSCKCYNENWPPNGNNADNYLNEYWQPSTEDSLYPNQTWQVNSFEPYIQMACTGIHDYMVVLPDVLNYRESVYYAIVMCRRCGHLAKVRIGPISDMLQDLELLNPQPTNEEESAPHD